MRVQSCLKQKFPKRTQVTRVGGDVNLPMQSLPPANAAIQQAPGDPEEHANDVGGPVVDVCATIKCRLYQFNGAAEGAGSRPNRPVRASGKASAAKAVKCTILSLPAGAGGGWSRGQSIATVSVKRTMSVSGMSRYLRMGPVYWRLTSMASGG